jgi:hypothetical protein
VQIDPDAPFSGAFTGRDGWGWVSNVIGAGASLGILTSLMVAMLGQARYLCVIGRSGVLPAWLAKVNARTATPINASAFLGESPLPRLSPSRQRFQFYETTKFNAHHGKICAILQFRKRNHFFLCVGGG